MSTLEYGGTQMHSSLADIVPSRNASVDLARVLPRFVDLRIDAPVHLSRPSPPCKRCARHKARSDQAVASGPSGARRSTLACDPST